MDISSWFDFLKDLRVVAVILIGYAWNTTSHLSLLEKQMKKLKEDSRESANLVLERLKKVESRLEDVREQLRIEGEEIHSAIGRLQQQPLRLGDRSPGSLFPLQSD